MNIMKRVSFFVLSTVLAAAYCGGAGGQTLSDALSNGEALALSPGVNGQVAEVLVKPGDLVQKGQLLLTLDSADFQSRLDAKLARQEYVKFKLRLLEDDYARQRELYEEGSLSTVELQKLDLGIKEADQSDLEEEIKEELVFLNSLFSVLDFSLLDQ